MSPCPPCIENNYYLYYKLYARSNNSCINSVCTEGAKKNLL